MNKIVMLGLATAVVLTSGCKGQPQQTETVAATTERVERVEATVLKETEIARQLELSTTLNAYETLNVSPSLTGLIKTNTPPPNWPLPTWKPKCNAAKHCTKAVRSHNKPTTKYA